MVYEAAATVALKGHLQHRGKKGRDQVAKEKKNKKKTRWSVILWIARKVCPAG
jgi:hypothetical protein